MYGGCEIFLAMIICYCYYSMEYFFLDYADIIKPISHRGIACSPRRQGKINIFVKLVSATGESAFIVDSTLVQLCVVVIVVGVAEYCFFCLQLSANTLFHPIIIIYRAFAKGYCIRLALIARQVASHLSTI